MKEKMKLFYREMQNELMEHRSTFLVYTGMRLLVLLILIMQAFNRNYENVFLCIVTLVLMTVPSLVQVTFRVSFPSLLEIIILVFIFAAEILGEISQFYIYFENWDTVLHTLNGFLCAAIGFSLVDIMNRQKRYIFEMTPVFMAIVAFCFSMTIGVLWEFFEFAMDQLLVLDMQKDTVVHTISSSLLNGAVISNIQEVTVNGQKLNIDGYLDIGLIDTMEDLIVNFIGALSFSVWGYFYLKKENREKENRKSVLEGLMPVPREDDWDKHY